MSYVQTLMHLRTVCWRKYLEKRQRKYVIGKQRKLLIQCFVIYTIYILPSTLIKPRRMGWVEHIDYSKLEQYGKRFHRTMPRTEDSIPHSLWCENLKSHWIKEDHVRDTSIEGWMYLSGPWKDRVWKCLVSQTDSELGLTMEYMNMVKNLWILLMWGIYRIFQ